MNRIDVYPWTPTQILHDGERFLVLAVMYAHAISPRPVYRGILGIAADRYELLSDITALTPDNRLDSQTAAAMYTFADAHISYDGPQPTITAGPLIAPEDGRVGNAYPLVRGIPDRSRPLRVNQSSLLPLPSPIAVKAGTYAAVCGRSRAPHQTAILVGGIPLLIATIRQKIGDIVIGTADTAPVIMTVGTRLEHAAVSPDGLTVAAADTGGNAVVVLDAR